VKPAALEEAELLDAICRRWPGYTLSSALEEDADLLLGTIHILALAHGETDGE
jgi:hypothetical protein